MRMNRLNRANTTGDHDGLVIASSLPTNGLLKDSEITTKIGSAKLIIKCRSSQWPINHDLQGACDPLRFAIRAFLPGEVCTRDMQVRYREPGETCFGSTTNPRCALVSDLPA